MNTNILYTLLLLADDSSMHAVGEFVLKRLSGTQVRNVHVQHLRDEPLLAVGLGPNWVNLFERECPASSYIAMAAAISWPMSSSDDLTSIAFQN